MSKQRFSNKLCKLFSMHSLEIIYVDEDLLIVNKPAGLLAVPGKGPDKADCLLSRICEQFPSTLIVHRLDQATSGLMVFARNALIQRALSKSFAAQEVQKTYLAVVQGNLSHSHSHGQNQEWQRIDSSLGADWPNRPKQKIDPQGKPSTTLWRCIKTDEDSQTSVLLLKPLSGRTHQLRVHLMSIGMPIIGDTLYSNELNTDRAPQHSRMLLHAYELVFSHPVGSGEMRFVVKPDFLDASVLAEL